MKSNAITRIILYSILIVLLLGILVLALCGGFSAFGGQSGEFNSTQASFNAASIQDLEIDWAAGTITIQPGDTDQIVISESGYFTQRYAMVCREKNGTLSIDHSSPGFWFGSAPSKDLTITVPADWVCKELELDGAALEISINDLSIGSLDVDGAANEITFTGSLDSLDCDGASCELTLTCVNKPKSIELDGASVELTLYLPEDCGFLVQMDGLSCSFHSDLDYTKSNGDYFYGNRDCRIAADGVSCSLTINHAPKAAEVG